MNRVVHFEIPASDPDKSMKFYKNVFGWKFNQFGNEQYWMVETGAKEQPGINGAIMKRKDPKQPMTNAIDVKSIDEIVKVIEASGGIVVIPKMEIPGAGWLAYFKDVDGNIFGLWQTT